MTKPSCLFLAVAVVLLGADDPKAKTAEERAKLRGTWELAASVFNGKAAAEDYLKQRQIVITDDQLIAVVAGEKKTPLSFALDPGHSPKHIDIKKPHSEESAHGIFELKGDELRLCYGEPGAGRPTEFASKEGEKVYLLVLKRSKKDH
jgi:uncharacterized protein (TIGR03067 family)